MSNGYLVIEDREENLKVFLGFLNELWRDSSQSEAGSCAGRYTGACGRLYCKRDCSISGHGLDM